MDELCGTRTLKVLNFLKRSVPQSVPVSDLRALSTLPRSVLSNLHTAPDLDEVTKNPELSAWLRRNPIPLASPLVTSGLMRGTFVFVRVTFTRPGKAPVSVSAADMQVARTYASLAVVPIQRYAAQYGIATLAVSASIPPFTAALTGDKFDDDDVRRFVDQIFQINQLGPDKCVVILHDVAVADSPVNTFLDGKPLGYHSVTTNFHPYCFCKVRAQNLSIADPFSRYADVLSHELAETAVDPLANLSNPEVCDACFGNCKNRQFDLFDTSGAFMGGTGNPSTASGFMFYIDSLIQPEFIDPDSDDSCAVAGADKQAVCIYPPPPVWSVPAGLTTITTGITSLAGHFSSADQRRIVAAGTQFGGVHEIFWKPGQVGIEGEDDLPVSFAGEGLAAIGSLYNSDDQRHLVVVGKNNGRIEEIFWKSDTVGIEGHDELPASFGPNSIVAVSGLYDPHQRRHLVIVGTKFGGVHDLFWRSDSVGLDGVDQLPVPFTPGSIAGVASIYNPDQRRYVVVVAANVGGSGTLHEIFWKADTVGIEGHDPLRINLTSIPIVAVAGLYDANRQRHVFAFATAGGQIRQVYWKAATVGIEAHSVVAEFGQNQIASLAAFYSASDQIEHIIVGLRSGLVSELFVKPDI